MTSHLGVMLLFGAAVSIVFGTLMRDDPRAQVSLAMRIFASLIVGGWLIGWVMYFAFA
ncbi:MAG TPA: hypothetical protein VMM93_04355 [Vicinamibacterales bacterium]|nr:hypothetical protein [Vicinamibacterales bacterium]